MSITVHFNGQATHLPAGSTLAALLAQQGLAPTQVATAVNAEFVPRDARCACVLREGDQVLTFQPITGG
ncbi:MULTISPECIES: sulfur carrier protein ThiS [Ramlibacter]|uniref:Sulfur carrier protein ThiS n=1 Tax=Ramlibacter aquaticus TaxID=2780094 RepID=A0ABR9SHP0_9BURK|nr:MULTISPECIES: sulfur carrier protein ThiS [Ramlibacter]MBE7941876.1 sulfur carrier protein ThiS [Ramlibacter aquaticus]